MFDRRSILNFDLTLLITMVLIFTIGVFNLYSSTYPHTGNATPLFLKQIYWFLIGAGLLTCSWLTEASPLPQARRTTRCAAISFSRSVLAW